MQDLNDFIYLIDTQNIQDIMTILQRLKLKNLIANNRDWYFIMLENDVGHLRDLKNHNSKSSLDSVKVLDVIQTSVFRGNEYADQEKKMNSAINEINLLLNANNPLDTFRALTNENAMLPQGLKEYAAPLYHFELQLAKQDKQEDLTHEELSAAVEVLQCVSAVNSALECNITEPLLKSLTLQDSYFENLNVSLIKKYFEQLKKSKESKRASRNSLLTHSEIQSIIDDCNNKALYENSKITCLERINDCLRHGNHKLLMPLLMEPFLEFTKLNNDSSEVYFYALQIERNRKRKLMNVDDLNLDEVKSAVNTATEILLQATRLGLKLTAINLALDKQDAVEIYHYLTNRDLNIVNVIRDCKEIYLQRMLEVRRFKINEVDSQIGSGWIQCRLPDRPISFYYNVKDRCLLWSKPDENSYNPLIKDCSLLNREELQAIIDMVNAEFKRELLFLSNEDFIIRLQSVIRGYLVREVLKARWRFFKFNIDKIVKIQAYWRMVKRRRAYLQTVTHYKTHTKSIVIVQSVCRMMFCRKRYLAKLKFYQSNLFSIIKIQACYRGYRLRKDYTALMFNSNPTIKTIKRFLHLLENSYNDYQEEIEIQSLKQSISNAIRQNRLLEEQIKEMDLKIGLLVRNRISLCEVLNHNKDMKHFRSNLTTVNAITDNSNDILLQDMINKTTRQKIESYQHLFYLLQTKPNYLANLVFEMPHMQQTKFVETVIFSLYNYGSSNRDEYLLLRLFRRAVECEINTKTQNHPNDFLSANPFVIKLIVGLCRTAHAQSSLKAILQPLIKSIIEDSTLKINTSPVEVYKQWVNELEVNSGAPCGLPYDVPPKVALKHPEVKSTIEKSVLQLKLSCEKFIKALLKSPDRLPYSMRYMAKNIKECLHKRFPEHPEKEILKVVGNLIYYRYINSAIVAPDAFDMLERNVAEVLPPDKRRNLAIIAKLLQFATANKGFGIESPHLSEVLNPFIRHCHEKFKEYFREVCCVEDPEKHFNMDQYTDLTSLTKPLIRMTIKELHDTHNLLIQYQNAIAPDPTDPLHELLQDLGGPPQVDHIKDTASQTTLIWLTLAPKYEAHIVNPFEYHLNTTIASGDRNLSTASNHLGNASNATPGSPVPNKQSIELNKDVAPDFLFIHTKRMLVDVLSCLDFQGNGADISQYLNCEISPSEESRHQMLIQVRQHLDRTLTPARKKIAQTHRNPMMELNLSLDEKRKFILSNLTKLETLSLITSQNSYQDIVNSISRDIRTLKSYRCHRKQEICHLKDIYQQLGVKRLFHEDQMDYYEKYCQSCLENMGKKAIKHSRSRSHNTTNLQMNTSQSSGSGPQITMGLPANQLNLNSPANSPSLIGLIYTQRKSLKFSAAELKKKGVVLEIDGLSHNQYKSLQFDIVHNCETTADTGRFEITAKFMGVQMDRVDLLLSDLLQMQYDGVQVMRMFDRAKVNLNLLIFLLNKKFFAK